MSVLERVVFDCNVYFQALIGPHGPAAMCLQAAQESKLELYCSEYILDELRNVCLRPHLVDRFRFTDDRLSKFFNLIRAASEVIDVIPHIFSYSRDPGDEHYIDLAAACHAHLIATRDRDLLDLNDLTTEVGRSFHSQFPDLLILRPEELLARIRVE